MIKLILIVFLFILLKFFMDLKINYQYFFLIINNYDLIFLKYILMYFNLNFVIKTLSFMIYQYILKLNILKLYFKDVFLIIKFFIYLIN